MFKDKQLIKEVSDIKKFFFGIDCKFDGQLMPNSINAFNDTKGGNSFNWDSNAGIISYLNGRIKKVEIEVRALDSAISNTFKSISDDMNGVLDRLEKLESKKKTIKKVSNKKK